MTNSDLNGWTKGQQPTLMQAFGFKSLTAKMTALTTRLPQVADGSSGSSASGSKSSGTTMGTAPAATGPLKQYARKLLRADGFGGQFDSLNSIIMAESGWNPHIKNKSSGAYGIAQALDHGNASTQGTESNMYGGNGLTDKQAKQANSGDGYFQLVWMLNYIKSRYGSPDAAWTFHKAKGWY